MAITLRLLKNAWLVLLVFSSAAHAADADIVQLLKDKGVHITESRGAVTALAIDDGSKLSDEDFGRIPQLQHLTMLSVSKGLNNARLSQLSALTKLEYLQTNLADVTDEGLKPMAKLKNLKNLKFFHPGKSFTGRGLAYLAELPNLESLTVAGSLAFGDEGLAAVAKLTGLKEFRTWHAGSTNDGLKKLKDLKNLQRLTLGQRLSYALPASPTDETLTSLKELKSLENLQLEEARLTYGALQQLKELPALKKLTLAGIDISKQDLERLRRDLPGVKVEWSEPSEAYQKRIKALFGG